MNPSLKIVSTPDGRPAIQRNGKTVPVEVRRCFPWTRPDGFLTLRDGEGRELALVESLDDLDPDSRTVLERELLESGRTFVIERIHSIQKEIELRCWEVDTAEGHRSFQTELDEWPRLLPDGSLLIQDLYGDLYRIPDPNALDPAGRKLLWPLLG